MAAQTSQEPTPPHHQTSESTNFKKKYKALKRKMRLLVYEQECFMEELRKAQRKLLRVSRDRSFLLDRLALHEKTEDTSSDSEATASSESDTDAGREGASSKKKRSSAQHQQHHQQLMQASSSPASSVSTTVSMLGSMGYAQFTGQPPGVMPQPPVPGSAEPPKKKAKVRKKPGNLSPGAGPSKVVNATAAGATATLKVPTSVTHHIPGRQPGHMTLEEVERHLELKQSSKPQFMSLEKTPYSLPDDIFSHDNSNQDSEFILRKDEDDELIIDMPQ